MGRMLMINVNQRKREFLAWILQHYTHEHQHVNYLLHFLMTQPDYIHHIHFSSQVQYAKRGILISYREQASHSFIYYKDRYAYFLPEQAFHDLRMNLQFHQQKTPTYIEFDLPDYEHIASLFDVYEDNEEAPVDLTWLETIQTSLLSLQHQTMYLQLKEEINAALDAHNYERANQLMQQLRQVEDEIE